MLLLKSYNFVQSPLILIRVHAKLCKLWVGVDQRLLSQVATQGAGDKLQHREQHKHKNKHKQVATQGAGDKVLQN